jgi:hypothetical protein
MCVYPTFALSQAADHAQLDTLVVRFFPSSTPSTTQNTSNSSYQNMNKVQAIWQKATPEPPESQALFSSPPGLAPPT